MDIDVGNAPIGLGHHQLSLKTALRLDLPVFDHREDVHGDLHVLPASPLLGAGLTAPLWRGQREHNLDHLVAIATVFTFCDLGRPAAWGQLPSSYGQLLPLRWRQPSRLSARPR